MNRQDANQATARGVQQVVAEAGQHAGKQAPHPDRPQQVRQERHAQHQAARDRQAAFAQALEDAARHHRIDQAAHGVHRHQRTQPRRTRGAAHRA
ncbi:hypothetical protein G6F58_013313 [Rhizopus delemar]|nr:hypothetical protein G6F58_013313 [Rhizopus delemar]